MSLFIEFKVMLYLFVYPCLFSQKPESTFVRHVLESKNQEGKVKGLSSGKGRIFPDMI